MNQLSFLIHYYKILDRYFQMQVLMQFMISLSVLTLFLKLPIVLLTLSI
jgi:hypothetical protein